MSLLTQEQRDQVAAAIATVERDTDAELVTVLAPLADDYRWIALLWAAIIALVLPGALLFFPAWVDARELLLVQWACFVLFGMLFRLPGITSRLVPRRIRHARAAGLARSQFLAQNLHRTADATGMLIFVSEAERYVEILVDHGIASHLPDSTWAAIVDDFTARVRRGDTLTGFLRCIEACGSHLKVAVPATHEHNELPNRLVVLD